MNVFRWVLAPLVATLVLLVACGGSSNPAGTAAPATAPAETPSGGQIPARSEPARFTWEPTGEYRTERTGIGLTVHSYIVNWDYIAILYSIDHSTPGLEASPAAVAITDDLGESYDVVSNSILGTALGVTAGVLSVEPYKGEGKTLTLTVTGVTTSSGAAPPGETVPGDWSVTFIENMEPGAPVDYTEGGRIAPEVVSAGELTMAVAGQPGGRFVKLLVDRNGQQDALYGVTSDGVTQPLDETEFREQLKAATSAPPPGFPQSVDWVPTEDFPPPPDWPAPADVP